VQQVKEMPERNEEVELFGEIFNPHFSSTEEWRAYQPKASPSEKSRNFSSRRSASQGSRLAGWVEANARGHIRRTPSGNAVSLRDANRMTAPLPLAAASAIGMR
jgi:hypothetical protein